jgi:hypothetical protein
MTRPISVLRALISAVLLLMLAPAVYAQSGVSRTQRAATPAAVAPAPFGPGEVTAYRVTHSILGRRGTAVSTIVGIDTLRGRPTYHLSFKLQGGMLGLSIDDHQESWLDIAKHYSLRFKQDLDQPRYERLRTLDFYPEDMKWRRVERPDSGELATNLPLDDVSFLYWARTLPLEVGETYTWNRYYKDEGNPVVVKVLRREQIYVPAGTFNTIVVQPLIRTSGLFSEGGEAEVYFSDDWRRIVVLVKTKLSFGRLQLPLQEYTPGELLGAATNVVSGRQ